MTTIAIQTPYQVAAVYTRGGTHLRGRIRFQNGSVEQFEFDLTEFRPAPHRCSNGTLIHVDSTDGSLSVQLPE